MSLEVVNGDKFFNKKPVRNKKAVSVLFLIERAGEKRELIKFSSIKRLSEYAKDQYEITLNRKKISKVLQTGEYVKDGDNKGCYVIALYNEKAIKNLSTISHRLPSSKIKLTDCSVSSEIYRPNISDINDFLIVIPKSFSNGKKVFRVHSFIVSWLLEISLIELFKRLQENKRIELYDCVITLSRDADTVCLDHSHYLKFSFPSFSDLKLLKDVEFEEIVNSQQKFSIRDFIHYRRNEM
ncbi:MAG: hypothetical protein J6S85_15265 [Methanobrevibacter sp.]|nr:hypothetical protein [Methanobrevibacter sp.]